MGKFKNESMLESYMRIDFPDGVKNTRFFFEIFIEFL